MKFYTNYFFVLHFLQKLGTVTLLESNLRLNTHPMITRFFYFVGDINAGKYNDYDFPEVEEMLANRTLEREGKFLPFTASIKLAWPAFGNHYSNVPLSPSATIAKTPERYK